MSGLHTSDLAAYTISGRSILTCDFLMNCAILDWSDAIDVLILPDAGQIVAGGISLG